MKAGIDLIEIGTPLCKYEGVRNVVPIFRQRVPRGADPCGHEDHGWRRVRGADGLRGRRQYHRFPGAGRVRQRQGHLRGARRVSRALSRHGAAGFRRYSGAAAGAGRERSRGGRADGGSGRRWRGPASAARCAAGRYRAAGPRAISATWRGRCMPRSATACRCRWSAGSASSRRRGLRATGCGPSWSAAISGVHDSGTRYGLPPDEIEQHVRAFIREVKAA